jgi:hypothetical protein
MIGVLASINQSHGKLRFETGPIDVAAAKSTLDGTCYQGLYLPHS